MDKKRVPREFAGLLPEDTDLTMFTIQNLTLVKSEQLVMMAIVLKRKVATELLTTYLPTILLLLITFVTIFFDKDLFADAIAVNLTIMLVMTTIFISKMEGLPPTSDIKMIDIWLVLCQMVPFAEVVLLTAMEYHREDGQNENMSMEMGIESPEEDEPKGKGCKRCWIPKLKILGKIYDDIDDVY